MGDRKPEELLKEVISSMVDDPDSVYLDIGGHNNLVSIEVYTADKDAAMVIGRGGEHAVALRKIFGATYGRLGKRLRLHIIDPRR